MRFQVENDDFLEELDQIIGDTVEEQTEVLRNVLDAVGAETVSYLRSYTSQRVPAVRRGEPERKAHPGGWGDVTSNLMNSYRYEVLNNLDGGLMLVLINGMEYAATLEARDGFFVLSGVTDRDGPVQRALRKVIETVAPQWQLETLTG